MALNRDVVANLMLNPENFNRNTKSAAASAKVLEKKLKDVEDSSRRLGRTMTQTGYIAAGFTAALVIGLQHVIQAAMEWETAWTGVLKTVDASDEQFAVLEGELRELAKTLPATHTEIAGVAEAAGQLGVAVEDIDEFTKTMIDMGVSTNLSAEDAAMAMGRFMNIMGTAHKDVDHVGAAVVDLGNKFASTEREIVTMALRIAGAGKTLGMAESDVLAFATALSSVGVYAEMGGSAISRVFMTVDEAVKTSSDKLDIFAQTAGMTAAQFAEAYHNDPAQAIDAFVQGLGRMQKGGQNVFSTLRSLGLSEIRVRDSLLRLASAGDLLNRSLDVGATAWDENIALLNEANRRYGTTASQVQIAMNRINDFAIDLGSVLLPAVSDVLGTLGQLASWFQDMPGWLRTSIVIIAAVAAGLAVLGTTALIALPKVLALKAAIDSMGGMSSAWGKFKGSMSGVMSFLSGPWGIGIGIAVTTLGILGGALTAQASKAAEMKSEMKELANTLNDSSADVTRETEVWLANALVKDDVVAAGEKLGISARDMTLAILGEADALDRVNKALDENLAKQEMGGSDETPTFEKDPSEEYTKIKEALAKYSAEVKGAIEMQQQINAALGEGTYEASKLSYEQRKLTATMGYTGEEAREAASEIDALSNSLDALYDEYFGLEEAEDAVSKAFADLKDSVQENGKAWQGSSEEALDNKDAIRGLIGTYYDLILQHGKTTMSESEVIKKTAELRQQFIDQMRAAGLADEAIEHYVAAFDGIPAEVTTTLNINQVVRRWDVWQPVYEDLDEFSDRHGMAEGGPVRGRGGPKDDLIPRWLSNGEFVMDAANTAKWWDQLNDMHQGRTPKLPVRVTGSLDGPGGQTTTINNHVNLRSYSDSYSTAQVVGDLEFMGLM